MPTPRLVEGRDYYLENGLFVLTALYLKERGTCCESGCRHCPYGYRADAPKRDAEPQGEQVTLD